MDLSDTCKLVLTSLDNPSWHDTLGNMDNELFRSHDVVVRAVGTGRTDVLMVTFGSYTDNPDPNREGFGEGFFRARGVDAIHVVNRENTWYQYAYLPDVLETIRAYATGYRRVFTYGSSMGAYAAIRFASAVGAHTAIAIAPQYSVDPSVFPAEHRWRESRGIAYILERRQPIRPVENTIIFYDPAEMLDRAHAARIAIDTAVTHVGILHAGHVLGVYLNEIGMLAEAIDTILADRFEAGCFIRTARSRRREAGKYFATLSDRCRTNHKSWALSFAHMAVAAQPADAGHMHNLAEHLAAEELFDEAADWEEKAMRLDPGCLLYRKMRGLYLLQAGRFADSRTIFLELIGRQPMVADHYHLVASSFGREGRFDEAQFYESQAINLDPAHAQYRADHATISRLARRSEREHDVAVATTPGPVSAYKLPPAGLVSLVGRASDLVGRSVKLIPRRVRNKLGKAR